MLFQTTVEKLNLNYSLQFKPCPLAVRYIKFLALTRLCAVQSWDIWSIEQRANQYKSSVVLYRPNTAPLAWWTKRRQVKLECTGKRIDSACYSTYKN